MSEAREAAAEALPLLGEAGNVWVFMDHFALGAALAGNTEKAARLVGFADASYAAKNAGRAPNEARARKRLQSLLDAAYDHAESAGLIEDGGRMSGQDAARLAVEE